MSGEHTFPHIRATPAIIDIHEILAYSSLYVIEMDPPRFGIGLIVSVLLSLLLVKSSVSGETVYVSPLPFLLA